MIYKSQILTEASGSVGGLTFSHNKGGPYTRARVVPCNPNSVQQQAIRAITADLTNRWKTTLTATQRLNWQTYADNVLIPNALGDPKKIPPLSHYVRCNVPRIQGNIARVDDAPAIFNLGSFTPPVITEVNATTDKVTFSLTVGDEWNVAGGALILFSARPQLVSVNYFKGPYRFCTSISGPAGTPQTKDLAFPVAAGQRVFFMFRFTQADGRLALPYRCHFLASTP